MESIHIRQATRGDIPEIVMLYNLSKEESTVTFDEKIVTNIYERLQKHRRYFFYVAVADERIVGTFMLLTLSRPTPGDVPEAIVENIAVHRKYQRQGIGRHMILFAVEKCKEVGCGRLVFSTNERNSGVHSFCEALGFERRGYGYVLDMDR